MTYIYQIITYILELGPGLVSIALVGHLGTKEAIDAATFGTMVLLSLVIQWAI